MSDSEHQTGNLEKALLDRATRLAEEYLQRARQQRDEIHHELREKLHIREERELLSARETGERVYQQKVQSSELQLQARLDNFRWKIINKVLDELLQKLAALASNEDEYLPVLKFLIQEAAAAIPSNELVVELNQSDHARIKSNSDLLQDWLPDKQVTLSDEIQEFTGGARLRDRENRVRVDNSFEGRIKLLQEDLEESIMAELFSKAMTTGEMLHG